MENKAKNQNQGRLLQGVVVSDKMIKTVVVAVNRLKKHRKYKKYFKVTKRYKAHDEQRKYHLGDEVIIRETRPLTKDKRWLVVQRIKEAKKED